MAPLLVFRPPAVQQVEIVPPDPGMLRVANQMYLTRYQNGDQLIPLTESLKTLQSLSAPSGDAQRYNRALNVLVVNLSEPPAASPEIALDLREAGDAGFLIISNGPVAWTIHGAPAGAMAKLAFESEAPLILRNAPPGIVAGFHIRAFGSYDVVTPADYAQSEQPWRFPVFCSAIRNWSSYFGVPFDQVRIWSYYQSPEYHLRSTAIAADGRDLQWPKSIAVQCAPRPAPPVDPPAPPVQRVRRRYY